MTQLSLSPNDSAAIDTIIEATLRNRNTHHMPMPVTHDSMRESHAGRKQIRYGCDG